MDALNGLLGSVGSPSPSLTRPPAAAPSSLTGWACSWPTPYPDVEQWALCLTVSIGTMLVYVVFSAFRTDNSAKVARKLEKAKLKVEALQAKLLTAENNEASRGGSKSSAKQVLPPSGPALCRTRRPR